MPGPDQPPLAPRRAEIREHHGDVVLDHYAWMSNKSDPELLSYLRAENAFAETRTAHLAGLREEIYADISARTLQTDLSVPDFVRHTDGRCFWYYARTVEGLDYPSYHRAPAIDRDHVPDPTSPPSDEHLLLDVNRVSAGLDFCALGTFDVSPDGQVVAFSVDSTGDERYQLRFLVADSGEALPDVVEEVAAGGCWSGSASFCYLTVDEAWRPDRLWQHPLGTDGADRLLWHEPDERFWLGVDESRDRRWVLISAASKNTSEVALLTAGSADATPRIVAARREGIEYDVEVADDRLFIVHNDGAPDFALAEAPLTTTTHTQWRPVRPGVPGVRLLGASAYDRALVLSLRRDALSRVEVRLRDSEGNLGPAREIAFDEPLFHVEADGGDEADTDRIRLHHQSMVSPPKVIEYRLDTGERRLLRQQPVLDHPVRGAYRPEDYVQRREWAAAADGTSIPVSLVYHADTPIDGSARCLLYGYGAYEIAIPPTFSIARLSLLDRGFVYAIAHVRGGGELGRGWYDAGRLADKVNTFTDFVACARHLVAAGYTSADRLAAEGGSAGGLLIGAAINLAPEAFRAVHAAVPFVDALSTILNPDLPLTVMEWEEWGDPLHDRTAYWRMKEYSPYENVTEAAYPAILVTASLNDTRVEVTEPAKWVARLRHTARTAHEILLKTELAAGHGGSSGRYQSWRDAAFELAWLIDQVSRPADG